LDPSRFPAPTTSQT
jgi:hypothetical protein